MNFVDAVKSGFRNYATIKGRAPRSEFWYWTLFTILISVFDKIVDLGLLHKKPGDFLPFTMLMTLILLLPNICIMVRRLHDVNRSGKWYFIMFTIIGIFFPILYWACTKGTTGPNRFGPDPLTGKIEA